MIPLKGDKSISPGQRPGLDAYWPFRPLLFKKFTRHQYICVIYDLPSTCYKGCNFGKIFFHYVITN